MVVCVWLVTDSVVLPVTRFSLYSTLTKVTFFSVENGYTFYNCSQGSVRLCVSITELIIQCVFDV